MGLSPGEWRRSSYSGTTGGNCVEVGVWRKSGYSSSQGSACIEAGVWHTSSHSGSSGGNCVQVAGAEHGVAVRDSKDPAGPRLAFSAHAWDAFLAQVKADPASRI